MTLEYEAGEKGRVSKVAEKEMKSYVSQQSNNVHATIHAWE